METALKNLDITVYLSNKNVVNSCGDHVGRVERIDVMKEASLLEKNTPFASHSMERILNFFKHSDNNSVPNDSSSQSWCVVA